MTQQLVKWTATRIGRRPMLKGTLGVAFSVLAGLTVGVHRVNAIGCTGPFGSGHCPSNLCQGSACTGDGFTPCNYVTGYCPSGGSCWTTDSGTTCCDCYCGLPGGTFYCACEG